MAGVRALSSVDQRPAYGPVGRSPWMDVDWHSHQRWVRVDGQALNVIELGEGPPVVFVHGLAGSWPNWLEQLPVLAERHRVITLDLPGFGHSPMPAEKITISYYARVLDGLLDTLEVDAAAFVGNSMGGFISAELAIAYPQRAERLVLVSPAGLSTYQHRQAMRVLPWLTRAERIVASYTAWTAAHSHTVTRRRGLRNATLGMVVRHPGLLPGPLAAEQVRGAGKPGFMQALRANLDYPLQDRLGEIACPTLIVWGEADRIISVRDAELFGQLIRGSRTVIFEDTGHVSMLERPEAFNELLDGFLSEQPE
jgi:pimeloyl-ACP methyl ester carboxylesterase